MRDARASLLASPTPYRPLLTEEEVERLARAVARYRQEGDALFATVSHDAPWDSLVPCERAKRLMQLKQRVRAGEDALAVADALGIPLAAISEAKEVSSYGAGRTHCRAGHKATAETTATTASGYRTCLICKRERDKESKRRMRGEGTRDG